TPMKLATALFSLLPALLPSAAWAQESHTDEQRARMFDDYLATCGSDHQEQSGRYQGSLRMEATPPGSPKAVALHVGSRSYAGEDAAPRAHHPPIRTRHLSRGKYCLRKLAGPLRDGKPLHSQRARRAVTHSSLLVRP